MFTSCLVPHDQQALDFALNHFACTTFAQRKKPQPNSVIPPAPNRRIIYVCLGHRLKKWSVCQSLFNEYLQKRPDLKYCRQVILLNEAFGTFGVRDGITEYWITHLFKWAREALPGQKLFLSDFGVWNRLKWSHILNFTRKLKSEELIDGLAVQVHADLITWPGTERLREVLNEINKIGVSPSISEATVFTDFRGTGEREGRIARQAGIYAEIAEAAIDTGCLSLGFTAPFDTFPWCWKRSHEGEEQQGLFDKEYQPKPSYYAVKDVFERRGLAWPAKH